MPFSPSHLIQEAEDHVKKMLAKDITGHDWYHIQRVRRVAGRIAKKEGANPFVVDLIALLHEATDRKLLGKKTEGKALLEIRALLESNGLDAKTTEEVLYVVVNQSYSKSGIHGKKIDSLAGQCVQDADRLEALGAIGIARCFAYNGKVGNVIYDPTIAPRLKLSAKEYKSDTATSINHFYEKLFKLKDLMNTKEGKRLAQIRHKFMEEYVAQFLAEWNSEI